VVSKPVPDEKKKRRKARKQKKCHQHVPFPVHNDRKPLVQIIVQKTAFTAHVFAPGKTSETGVAGCDWKIG